MRRHPDFLDVRWDDPIWNVCRVLLDIRIGGRYVLAPAEEEIIDLLRGSGTDVALGLADFLDADPDLLGWISHYLEYRVEAETLLASKLRSEDEALEDLRQIADVEVRRYGTQSADHHQSSQAAVAAVSAITEDITRDRGLSADTSPQARAVVMKPSGMWVSPRRLDGALAGLWNPVGVWEIKEYWGTKGGGSKMSDAIYEVQLVGMELRAFEDLHGPTCKHYFILDGRESWASRRSDLRRAVDLLSKGLVDEVIAGTEILEEWPRVVNELCDETEKDRW